MSCPIKVNSNTIELTEHTSCIKVNSNTIELTEHTSCYCILDLLCVKFEFKCN